MSRVAVAELVESRKVRPVRAFDRLANRPVGAVGVVCGMALLVSAGLSAIRRPFPRVHDEFCNVLAADTFCQGRLSMPTHPFWPHFETFHVLMRPTYASKYPPFPALLLAAGQWVAGSLLAGSWLGFALAAGATCWMLQGWTRPRWALLGGLLVALHHGAHGGIDAAGRDYSWSQGFWGGSAGLLGGSLVLGAVARLRRRGGLRPAAALGLGLGILAATRPFEGAILGGLSVAWWLVAAGRDGTLRGRLGEAAVAGAVLLPALGLLGLANRSVTGSPFRMPYSEYESQYDPVPVFTMLGRPKPPPGYRHAELERFYNDWCLSLWTRQQTPAGWWAFHRERLGWLWRFYVGPLVLPALLIPAVLVRRRPRAWFAAGLIGACVGVHGLTMGVHPHYVAPAAGAFVYLVVEGLRLLGTYRFAGIRVGRMLVVLTLLMVVVKLGLVCHARATAPESWEEVRAGIEQSLRDQEGSHLVVVRYAADHDVHAEWVYNAADIDKSRVVWAREMDPASMRRLLGYFKERRVWLVEPDQTHPSIRPYSPD
ncbi:MAG: hypothetical protein U0835_24395 [Isosphaeraceae bacterium]